MAIKRAYLTFRSIYSFQILFSNSGFKRFLSTSNTFLFEHIVADGMNKIEISTLRLNRTDFTLTYNS